MNNDYLGFILSRGKVRNINESDSLSSYKFQTPVFKDLKSADFYKINESSFTGIGMEYNGKEYRMISESLTSEDFLNSVEKFPPKMRASFVNQNVIIYESEVNEITQSGDMAQKTDYPVPVVGNVYEFEDGSYKVSHVEDGIVYLEDEEGEYYSMEEQDFNKEVITESDSEYHGYTIKNNKGVFEIYTPEGEFLANVDSFEEAKAEIQEDEDAKSYFGVVDEEGTCFKADIEVNEDDEESEGTESFEEVTLEFSPAEGFVTDDGKEVIGEYNDELVVVDQDNNLFTKSIFDEIGDIEKAVIANAENYNLDKEITDEYILYTLNGEGKKIEIKVYPEDEPTEVVVDDEPVEVKDEEVADYIANGEFE